MGRALILFAGLGLSAAAGPVLAQPTAQTQSAVTREYDVEGNAPGFCAVGAPTLSQTSPTSNVRNVAGGVVTIDTLADPTTLTTRSAQFGVQVEAVCNQAHRLTITSENNGLWRDPVAGVVPAAFAGAIPYRATMAWAGDETQLTADAESRREQSQIALVAQPNIGNVVIDIAIEQGATNKATNTPLLAGTYRDTLRVTIEPQ